MKIKTKLVTRSQYVRKELEAAKQTAIVQALRRENNRLRNWATGLAILSGTLAIGIMVLIFPLI